MSTYDITSHPLLSDKAEKLLGDDSGVFDAVVIASERALGLHGTVFTGEEAENARLAVTYQVNHELELTPESSVYETVERGERRWTYRSDIDSIHPKAQLIAGRLLGSNEDAASSRKSKSVAVSNVMTW